jgi:phenylalanyl-tRNA synthetase beta chain
MKVSLNWLKNYLNIELAPDQIASILTETGLEVESVEFLEAVQGGLSGVVVGEVLTCEKHPDAEKLKVTTVNLGDEVVQIVCGAPNVAAGQKVLVATVGCTLYPKPDEPFKIKSAKIRGVASNGMICAEDELGIGASHDGILVLPNEVLVGLPASKYFDLESDAVFEIGLTPNRADAMGHIGVARDLKAYLNTHQSLGLSLHLPEVAPLTVREEILPVNIVVEATDICQRYTGVTIVGVKVGPSPEWLQKRLRAVGLSPINNVVDVTNFVMRELGTPLHAFDAAVVGQTVVVKKAKNEEKFTTLDGVTHILEGEELMISNTHEHLCIAGVFGGQHSGITEDTTAVFLESALFHPVSVRKTAKKHNLHTDASFRFERGVDPNLTLYALRRATNLIMEVTGGTLGMNEKEVYPNSVQAIPILVSLTKMNTLFGQDLEKETVLSILNELDFKVLEDKGDELLLESPLYRVDVTRWVDVAEEVLRIYGFNKILIPEKWSFNLPVKGGVDKELVRQTLSEFLVGKGMNEVLNNSLTKKQYTESLHSDSLQAANAVSLLNPLSQDLGVMRQSLLFGLLENARYNQNRQQSDLKLFENGKIYWKTDKSMVEEEQIGLLFSGKKLPENWNHPIEKIDFFYAKGIIESVFQRFGLLANAQEESCESELLEGGVVFTVFRKKVAALGKVANHLKKQFDIKQDVYYAEIYWENLLQSFEKVNIKFKEIPKSFAVRRDYSLTLDKSTTFKDLKMTALKAEKKLLKEVGLFDVYEGDKLPEGKKSYALSFVLQDGDRTLQDDEIHGVMDRIKKAFETEHGAQLRES